MKIAKKLRFRDIFSRRGNSVGPASSRSDSSSSPSSPSRWSRQGVALITVLTVMALTTILVLTFFSLATSEHRASNTYSYGLQAQQVAEQAVNMVIAQVREATDTHKNGDALNQRMAWASQPGAIRTWQNSGQLDAVYKLYSAEVMKTSNPTEIRADFEDLKRWADRPEHYVDLNEPVIRGEKAYYPIVHPAAMTLPKWEKALDGETEGVEGFKIEGNVVESGSLGADAARVADVDEHAAMPVKWIYQLGDGTLGVLDEGGSAATGFQFRAISGSGTPTAENQIVARFAFWADDETSKLNLNTHAGGLAWDIPKAGGELDMNMGKYQPAQKEWQRYPGHPATVHLGAALAPGVLDIVNDRDAMEMLYRVVPRVVGGGSESGTRLINTRNPAEQNGLVPDTDPLFPSIDDMVMRPDREPHKFPDSRGQPLPESELAEYLERSKFFITAHSRAPDVNQFDLPKVAIWPIYNADRNSPDYELQLTAFDRLIHYCATVGDEDYDYIFKREKADSTTHDYERIPRNQQIYEYLDRMMSSNMPGYGGTLRDKYGPTGQRQLLTQIFDYIRSTNLHDDTLYEDFEDAFRTRNTSDHLTFTNPRDGNPSNKGFGNKGHGQVTPIRIDDTKGNGRFFTLSGADIAVGCVAQPNGAGNLALPLWPGIRSYGGRYDEQPSGIAYTNLPPLPPNVQRDQESTWPAWLKALEMSGPAAEFEAAFHPENWNWNLAYLDPNYADLILADPTANKFNRSLLTGLNLEMMRLQPGEKLVQASFLFNLFCPSIGWGSINPNMQIEIKNESGMTFSGVDGTYGFLGWEGRGANPDGAADTYVWATNWIKPHREGGVRAWGGLLPFTYAFQARDVLGEQRPNHLASVWRQLWGDGQKITSPGIRSRLTPLDRGYNHIEGALDRVGNIRHIEGNTDDVAQSYRYDLVTIPFRIDQSNPLEFEGGNVSFRFFDGGEYCENSARDVDDPPSLVQTIELEFPRFSFRERQIGMADGRQGWVNEFGDLSSDSTGVLEFASMTADPANPWDTAKTSASMRGGSWGNSAGQRNNAWFGGERAGLNSRGRMADASLHWNGPYLHYDSNSRLGDVVQSVSIPHGDVRLVAAKAEIEPGDGLFVPHRDYGAGAMAHSLTNAIGQPMPGFSPNDDTDYLIVPGLPGNNPYRGKAPLPFATESSADVQRFGDFDNGAGTMIDGPYINKPDEGNVHSLKTKFTQEVVHYWEQRRNYGEFPYFSNPEKNEAGGPSYFSPNRIVSGPGMFGSLPTGLETNTPWQTLLFRPNVSGGRYSNHPGAGASQGGQDPPDHVLLELFWMPVVEPYAISEPLSTAGKININYEIVPFLHIDRSTALRGVFRSELMLCIPNELHHSYKHDRGRGRGYHWRDRPFAGELQGKRLRSAIVESATLQQFKERFDNGADIFRSASEICEIHLVPQEFSERMGLGSRGSIGSYTPTVEQLRNGSYWSDHALVGDNARERPYTNIHQRITTKSNTFQVHYRAQILQQSRRESDAEYGVWRPEVDSMRAEYRGSSIVERFVNPNDPDLPDFATNPTESLNRFYQFRVVNPRRFAP